MSVIKGLLHSIHMRMRLSIFNNVLPRVARRYMTTNMYDGSLLAMGIIMSSTVLELMPRETIINGLLVGFSSAISGFTGVFLVEKAELSRELRELEKHLFTKLKTSAVTAGMLLSLINASSILTPILLALTPFLLAEYQLLVLENARILALGMVFVLLLVLGVLLGQLARENPLKYGALTLLSGALVTAIDLLLHP